jgi:hypothetical protein
LTCAALLGALGYGELEAVLRAPLHEHAVELAGAVHALSVEDRVATREAAEPSGLERAELRDAQRLDPDQLRARAGRRHYVERQQRQDHCDTGRQ